MKEISQYEGDGGTFEEGETYINERISFQNSLEIKNISWKYLNAQNNVFQGLSLTIHKGESVAFIGASGGGKTTLVDVIMGLLRPQAGSVEMDGTDIFSIPHQWSQVIGYVPQSVFLIDDTVRSNVAFGLKKEDVSDDKIWAALDTENAVMESIDALQGSKTLIIVAHRLTTIRNCDKIYKIKDGVAVEQKKEEVLGE